MRCSIFALALSISMAALILVGASAPESGLSARVAQLEAQVAAMHEILKYVHVETGEINYVNGPHWIIEGVNVHVRSGSGRTDDCPFDDSHSPCDRLTELGNLIVGYNEITPCRHVGPCNERSGSHNLIVGDQHEYTSFGGFVAGEHNWIYGEYSSVSGGWANRAIGYLSSVSGGNANYALGVAASISGGNRNEAFGDLSSVSGGEQRVAPGDLNWAAGSLFEPQ